MLYDLVIIGGGPAGCAAAVYASRKQLRTLLLTAAAQDAGGTDFGGQSVVSSDIQNWIGTISVSGTEFATMLENHVRAYAGDVVSVHPGEKVSGIKKTNTGFTIATETGKTYDTKTVLVATGSSRRKLTVPGATDYEHKGITYCASCDGPIFAGKDVVVIGGGNAAFESAAQLLAYAKSVTLLHRNDTYRADPITVRNVLAHPSMKAITNAELLTVYGTTFVTGLSYKDTVSKETRELATEGIFVEIGLIPATGFVDALVELNQYKQIIVDPKTQRASLPGVWAAGDCTDGLYHQNNIAAGDAVKALEDIYLYLRAR